jgi:(1->4)-alpha-D-glucan 1-alpha-D-glucosylmutase
LRRNAPNGAPFPVLKPDDTAVKPQASIPRATYRFQFNKHYTLRQATALIPYLSRLGVSHCYASPLLKAREGSPHGYDISDHRQLNPEIGSQEEFEQFSAALKAHGMGLILDTVPNHMAANKDNPWWMDVLENGPASLYADYFDIDWHPLADDLQNKILLPILGDTYGKILENGELRLRFALETGQFWLDYYDSVVPINPSSYPVVLKHRLEILEARLGKDNPAFLEYQSIISAFEHLPMACDDDASQKEARSRERRVGLGRLTTLMAHAAEIRQFIDETVRDFQPNAEDSTNSLRLHRLLEQQSYRLSNWRVASDEINYRRFFDVNDLVGVRVEDPRVFNDTHALIMEWIEKGLVQGLRVDHPDGLYDPAGYFNRLQEEATRHLGRDTTADWRLSAPDLPLYVLIEKILAPFERLPDEWAVHGTTGYEFVNAVNGLFVCQENERELTHIYEKVIGQAVDFDELVYYCKKLIMKTTLNGELGVLSHSLIRLCKANWSTRDFTLYNLRSALMEVVASFPVYRTYVTPTGMSKKDGEYIDWAVKLAKRRSPATDPGIFDFIRQTLLLEFAPEGYFIHSDSNAESIDAEVQAFRAELLRFALKFQQYTGPVMAKGLEDTSFYRFNRLVSLNEVGGEPRQFGLSVVAFHHQNQERLKRTPHTLLATSTHDTKRSEDVRARISVLSEMPEEWYHHVSRWRKINRHWRKPLEDDEYAPSLNSEYLFYQTLLGVWPLDKPDADGRQQLADRLEAYMLKAVREAKSHTSWINQNANYEDGLIQFVRNVVLRSSDLFLDDFLSLQSWVARLGLYNSLAQTLLKLTSPGVPDIYQGTELWDFSLVDPDNRRPVDYAHRQAILVQVQDVLRRRDDADFLESLAEIVHHLDDGRAKAYLMAAVLAYRAENAGLFEQGAYYPLTVSGTGADYIVAFARQSDDAVAITVVPRLLYTKGLRRNALPCGKRVWQDTALVLPETMASLHFKGGLDGQRFAPAEASETQAPGTLSVAAILEHFPVGFLVSDAESQ